MKRKGHIYEQMSEWENIVEAERIATRRKAKNPGVRLHERRRWSNLVEIQRMVLDGRMRTDEYRHEERVSGQGKLRDIAKLRFHPSHIQHQLLTLAAEERVDRSLIRHTYASRRGMGQIACALQIRKNLKKYIGQPRWYGQGDICKYYDSIPHGVIRRELERRFKDSRFVEAFMEPFTRFSPDGVSIPLGIRPSQTVGNLVLSGFDRFMAEAVKAEDYVRYLDDFLFTGATKWEVKWRMKRAERCLNGLGFRLHVPKIRRVSEGVDMMGFVFYGRRGGGWWRSSNKHNWLRRRSKVTNPKRRRELDDAAWGMLKWGNKHCRRLFQRTTGAADEEMNRRMGITIKNAGIPRRTRADANGVPFIEAPRISMEQLLLRGEPVECTRWVKGVSTTHGDGRYALLVRFYGMEHKLIVNSQRIKSFIDDMEAIGVTRLALCFTDPGGKHYDIDTARTEILDVNGRAIEERDGRAVYADDGTPVEFKNVNQ